MLTHLSAQSIPPERVVILGAGGFVGGAIASCLARDGIAVRALGRPTFDLLAPDAGDRLASELRPTDVLVFVSAIAPCKSDAALMQNLAMAQAVNAAIKAAPPGHLVYVSSDAVYADDANPVRESSCTQPSGLHGIMHLAREVMLKAAWSGPLCILRPSLLYGAKDPHNGYGPNRFRRLAADGKAIELFGEGEEKRDHVLIDDVAAIAALVLKHRSVGILNVATGASHSFREVAELVMKSAPRAVPVRGTPRRTPLTHRHFDVTAGLRAFPNFHYTPLELGIARVAKSG